MRVRVERTRARRGDEATLQTVALIRRAIVEGSQNWKVRQCALGIVRAAGVRAKDYAGELCALYAWCAQRLRYTRDPSTAELVQTPEVLLGQIEAEGAGGDCDDQGAADRGRRAGGGRGRVLRLAEEERTAAMNLQPLEAFLGVAKAADRLLDDAALPWPLRTVARASLMVAFGLIGFGHTRQVRRELVSALVAEDPDELFRAPTPRKRPTAPRRRARAKTTNGVGHSAPRPDAAA